MLIFWTCPAISLLFTSSDPAAITWAVIAIIVLAIQCEMPRRTLSHVFEESEKAFSPTLAHSYSASSVIFVLPRSRIVAALNNSAPNHMFGPAFAWTRSTVNKARILWAYFCLKASAALDLAASQIGSARDNDSSAIAFAFPSRRARAANWRHAANDNQFFKTLACKFCGTGRSYDSHVWSVS